MEVKVVLCNCKGLCPSFKETDMDTLLFDIESNLDATYAVLNAQLCGQGGNAVLRDVLRNANDETYVVVGACAPEAQVKLFKKLLRETGFDERRFIPVDIRNTNNEGVIARLKEAVQQVAQAE
jgi:heterodisulfide reductase subunit A-like polyferredoxin